MVANANPVCSLECKMLSTKDYVDLLWTTCAEFPGESNQHISCMNDFKTFIKNENIIE